MGGGHVLLTYKGATLEGAFSLTGPGNTIQTPFGSYHFAFWVDDIDGIIARARAGGFDVIMPHESPTHYYGEPEGNIIRSVFMRDPDGNVVQCDQRA